MPKNKTVFEDCDVLVVGGGMAGTGATFEARHWGRDLKIVCVEKTNIDRMNNILHLSLEQIRKISILLNPINPIVLLD